MIDININYLVIEINNIISNKIKYDKLTITFAYAFFEIIDDLHFINDTFLFILNHLKYYINCTIDFDLYEYIMKHNVEINTTNFISQMSSVLLSSCDSITSLTSQINKDTYLIHTIIDSNIDIKKITDVFNYYDFNKDGLISALDVILYLKNPQPKKPIIFFPYINVIINLIYNSYKKIELHEFIYYFEY